MTESGENLIKGLLEEVSKLEYRQGNLDGFCKRAVMIAKKIFGQSSHYVELIEKTSFSPAISFDGMDSSYYRSSYDSGKEEMKNTVNVMLEDLQLSRKLVRSNDTEAKSKDNIGNSLSNKVFIVHGHNEEMKQSAARFIEKIKLEAIILHEQASMGKTIIEKFTDNSDVSFALVLLSADDLGISKNGNLRKGKLRARQNVIFELGFFLGKLGREKVVVLHEMVENFEFPSDYQGVIYIPYDVHGNWRFQTLKEMKAVGHEVDANILF